MSQSTCRCLIKHAVSADERKLVVENLEYTRSINDNVGIMLSLAQLQPCPTTESKS